MAGQRSSSSSSSFSFTHDVFLSFNGSDTRPDFTDNLLKALRDRGIRIFIEEEELRRENEITPALVKAIEESRIAIIVLSKNYAASSLCLEELVSILDQRDRNHLLVFPVFYDVDPSDVRKQRGTYGEALARHEEKFKDNNHKVLKWRNALCQVAYLSGWHFKQGIGYDEFEMIEKIVEEASWKLNRAPLHVVDYVVGLDSTLEEVHSLLELESDSVIKVGIHGMGGLGKTTLARAVYDRIAHRFEASCFLGGVRENSIKHGLVHLQNMLLSLIDREEDIQLRNANKGVSIIKRRLHQKKVLLILDDVDTLEQLEALVGGPDWSGSGSRVIITTRDRHLLAFHRVERRYEVQKLSHNDALELLSHKIFQQGNIDPSYIEILNQVVAFAFRLPLALEVIGSYLVGKNVDEWIYALDRFQRIPYNDIQKILRVSLDALGKDDKSVFLDIACCFKGYELTEVQDILCAHHGYNVKYHIKVLIDKSLISISSDGKVTIHPLIEDMGKEIVRRESPTEPGNRNRLWFPEDIVQLLKNNTGTSKIELIHLDSPLIEDEEVIEWDGEALNKMENLRTLIIRRYLFSKAPKNLPSSLRVLEWWRYLSQELPSDFVPKQLDICKLPNMGFMSPKRAELLKTSQSVPEVYQTSQSVPKVFQTSQRVARVKLWISQRVFQAEITWRLVGFVSSVVGLLCYALSPSFNRLIGGWNSFKFILYGLLTLVICTTILFAKQSSLSTQVQLKAYMSFAVLMIILVYSFFYDRAVNGKPEILNLVSNAAFALVSLSLSKLIKFWFEMGIFSYFLGCLAVQLWTIDKKLILVAIIFGFPLFIISSDSQLEVDSGGRAIHSSLDLEPYVDNAQVIHSSSDSNPQVGNAGQAIYSTLNYQPDVGNGSHVTHSCSGSQPEVTGIGQIIHSSSDSRPEAGSGSQHVVDIHT